MAEQNTAKERLLEADRWLDDYESKLGLPGFNESAICTEIGNYLTMDQEALERLDPESCSEIAAICAKESFNLQRAYNREVAHITWANDALKLGVAGKTSQYGGSFIQQEMQAIKEDEYLEKVFKIKSYAQQRVDRLNFLATTLNRFSDRLDGLQAAKNRKA
jgi:hypothetical protein